MNRRCSFWVPGFFVLVNCTGATESRYVFEGTGGAGGSESPPKAAPSAATICGDGMIAADEECDDANAIDADGCTNACKNARCGDGILQPDLGEACDDGGASDTCISMCLVPGCGDGIQQRNEACDDGNLSNTDECTTACKRPECGDGFLQAGEACDDGNELDDDGCTNACARAACGDRIRQANEECDDGDEVETDMCTSQCKNARCGDSIKAAHEECDDGNAVDDDACTSQCKNARCADGIRSATEECDDGNTVNDDECSNSCKGARCGDSIVQAAIKEACDDGNAVAMDGCSNRCRKNQTLAEAHSGCNDSADSRSGACSAAARRYCSALDDYAGGLVQEANGSSLGLGCLPSGSSKFSVPAPDVKAYGEDCSSPGGAACMTAARDFCKSKNSGFEFGMVQENNSSVEPSQWLVACAPAQRVSVSLANLAEEVGGNCSESQLKSLAQSCVSAAHAYCQDRVGDQQLGGGMIMNIDDTNKIQLACLKFSIYGDVPFD